MLSPFFMRLSMNKELTFYSLLDFYPRKEQLKNAYDLLSTEEIIIYKMYVYSLPWMDDDVKDLIWEYFNDWSVECLSELAKKYRKKKQKVDKRQKEYDREKMQDNVETG